MADNAQILELSTPLGRVLFGNILFVVCCAFYLSWWVLRFRPGNPIVGLRSGWLLLPAAVAGLAAVVFILWGVTIAQPVRRLFPNVIILVGWIVGFILLIGITYWLFDRPVTSELFLFTGWAALALAEVNTLYGSTLFSRTLAAILIAVVAVITLANLVCYILYYRLGSAASFIDGMIPLLLTGIFMIAVSICMAASSRLSPG